MWSLLQFCILADMENTVPKERFRQYPVLSLRITLKAQELAWQHVWTVHLDHIVLKAVQMLQENVTRDIIARYDPQARSKNRALLGHTEQMEEGEIKMNVPIVQQDSIAIIQELLILKHVLKVFTVTSVRLFLSHVL